MNINEIYLPQHFYLEHLQRINGVKFTRREIDIISFIISGRSTKKIASFFSLSPRTVDNYIHNIMLKLDCNSRELIIDFIENSNHINLVRQHYSFLLIQVSFQSCLREISKLVSKKESAVVLVSKAAEEFQVSQLKNDLKVCGVNALETEEVADTLGNFLCVLIEETPEQYSQNNCISMNFQNYYESVFSILKTLFPNFQFDEMIEEFRKKCRAPPLQSLGESSSLGTTRAFLKKPRVLWMFLCLASLVIVFVPLYFRHNFERDYLLKARAELLTSWTNHYEPHVNQAISHAKFFEWRGNALNIPEAKKISEQILALDGTLDKDIKELAEKKILLENTIFVFSPLNWNLFKKITNFLHNQTTDLYIAASFNKASKIISHDTFQEAIYELDNHVIKYLTNKARENSTQNNKNAHTYLAIAVNMRNGVAKKRLLDTKQADKLGYISALEGIIKELSVSAKELDNANFCTFLNIHRANIECALREENSEKKRKFEQAAKLALSQSIQLAQSEGPVLQEMAYHYKYTNEKDRALLAYDSALKLEPTHTGLLYGRAELCLRMGEESGNSTYFEKALNDIIIATTLKPNDCDMLHLLVWANIHASPCNQATYVLEKEYKPLCVAGTEDWDDMSGIRDEDVKWLEKKLNDKCSNSSSLHSYSSSLSRTNS